MSARLFIQIIKYLQQTCYGIGRVSIAGSIGKKTNILLSDIDCVLFVNDEEPPFDDILELYYKTLCDSPFSDDCNLYKNRHVVKIRKSGFRMDLVPAPNFLKTPNQKWILMQQLAALERIKRNPRENCYKYSSALAVSTVQFMKERDGFTNQMARIAKFWYKSLSFNEYISGASLFIELVAVYAAKNGYKGNRRYCPHLKAFIRFLLLLMRFDELDVIFEMDPQIFGKHLQHIDTELPRVIDPVNPYNNLVRNWNTKMRAWIVKYAEETYERLRDLVVDEPDTITMEHLIDDLFEEQ